MLKLNYNTQPALPPHEPEPNITPLVEGTNEKRTKDDGKRKTYRANIFHLIKENDKLPPPEFYWGPLQPRSFGFIFGPAKSGKTIFCENMGMAMAAGQDTFFGQRIKKGIEYRVLFISIEEEWRNRTSRNTKQVKQFNYKEADLKNYHVVGDNFPEFSKRYKTLLKL